MVGESAKRNAGDIRSRRREQLVVDVQRIALRQFVEQGYEATTLKGICEEAGISLRTLFRHFKNKDQILASRMAEWSERIPQEMEQVPLSVPFLDAYRTALQGILEEIERDRDDVSHLVKLFDQVPAIRGEYLGGISGHAADKMTGELARRLGIAATDPMVRLVRSFLAVAVVQAMADWSDRRVPGALSDVVSAYLEPIAAMTDSISHVPRTGESRSAAGSQRGARRRQGKSARLPATQEVSTAVDG